MDKMEKNEKKYVGFFGRCNVGKSSLINALTGQGVSIVSEQRGTTTDVVRKSMELFGYGAVVLVDTAGLDDMTDLGRKRVEKSMQELRRVDAAVLVVSENRFSDMEKDFLQECKHFEVPCLVVYNKEDVCKANADMLTELREAVSSEALVLENHSKEAMLALAGRIGEILRGEEGEKRTLLQGIVESGEVVLLVTPIDSAAPQGRLILPQVQLIREVLDKNCVCMVVKETELEYVLNEKGIKPDLVVTDSQVFAMVNAVVPKSIPLTSFSILLARMKGMFDAYLKGTPYLDSLKDGDRVLMLESCTHQPTCEDIGRVKLPKLIRKYTGKDIHCEAVSGLDNIETPLREFALIIQCGGCVASRKQLRSRLKPALENNIPVSNYGLAIAYMNGIFERATEIFK